MGNGGLKEFFIENERILCYHGDLLYEVSTTFIVPGNNYLYNLINAFLTSSQRRGPNQ